MNTRKLLGNVELFRELEDSATDNLKKEIAHIGVRTGIEISRLVVNETIANKNLFKVVNGLLDLGSELNDDFLGHKEVVQAETIKLGSKMNTQSQSSKVETQVTEAEMPVSTGDTVVSDELEQITLPKTQVD